MGGVSAASNGALEATERTVDLLLPGALLVPISPQLFAALMFVDLRFTSLFQ